MTLRDPARAQLLSALIVVGGALLRLYALGDQPLLDDEVSAAATAAHYVDSGQFGPTMWYHPNLRNLVLWLAMRTAGPGALALRATSATLGILSIPLLALLVHEVTGDRRAALLASFLLALDQVHITFSREAIQETWTTFFFLAGTLAAVAARTRRRPWLLAAAGLAFGLGISCKFHALLPLAVCWGFWLRIAIRERSPALACWLFASLALLPALVFLATYGPWFARGYGAADWMAAQRVLISKMLSHAGNPMDQSMDTAAWQWFLRPMGYADFVLAEGRPLVTLSFSNPVVWLTVLPATAYLASRSFAAPRSAQTTGERLALLLFAASYLPLALASRPIWLLSSLAVLPFAFMILGLAASRLLHEHPRATTPMAIWGVLVMASSLALYPLATGYAQPNGFLGGLVERFRPAQGEAPLGP